LEVNIVVDVSKNNTKDGSQKVKFGQTREDVSKQPESQILVALSLSIQSRAERGTVLKFEEDSMLREGEGGFVA
jgi:hypothetical protein